MPSWMSRVTAKIRAALHRARLIRWATWIGKRIGICGTNGDKFDAVRKHWEEKMPFKELDISFESYPPKGVRDATAYKAALEHFKPGDVCSVFTPDDTHFAIAEHCIKHGIHVMITKPPVKTLEEHNKLAALAKEQGVLCCIEVHKRYDPIYRDARRRRHLL